MGAVNSCAAHHGGGYLLQAITNGDDLAFRRALSQQPSLAFWSNIVSRKTLLHAAAAVGRRDLVKMLIMAAHYHAARHCRCEADAQVAVRALLNRATTHGLTALMVACRRGHADVAAALLGAGADPLLADRHEHTCLHYAALFGWANCVAALLEGAVRLGGAAPLTWLKDVRMDAAGLVRYVDARAAPGLTPLHLAAMHGRAAAVAALLAAGADVAARVGGVPPALRGEAAARWPPAPADAAPVHLAAAANSVPVVRLLMEAWAQRELATRGGGAGAGARGAPAARAADPRQMRTWSGLRPVDIALTSGAAPSIVRMLEVDVPPEALLPHYCGERVPKLARLAAAAHRGLLLRNLARAGAGQRWRH
ncbi:hypothetical protein WJX81_001535 [Elliptochloris bilobata]|uniref:Uncharacterized protein n=1 Tax=Elliptochloris bilobata TaxID=381761 RepID=A0AAW1RGA7_9CHLO